MESKRKANGHAAGGAEELDDRAAKRRKMPDVDLIGGETADTTTQIGLPFIEQVKRTADKSGRLVATNFLVLPSKRDLPDYYRVIKMPIALDTIEGKLKRREFRNLTSLESYIKRMIANAKEYNQKGSEIYDDAERIRKALSNFMTKNNPAYKTPGYVAFPTPLPGEKGAEDDAEGSEEDAEGEVETETPDPAPGSRRKSSRPSKTVPQSTAVNGRRSSVTPSTMTDSQYANVSFQGLTFQQAQEKVVGDTIMHKEDEDDEFPTYEPFISLPPKSLRDYYQVIPHPVSLRSLQKRVRGIHGRGGSTGISDFKTWKSFEEEADYIWQNAWHYNEDGSDISLLAKELEVFVNRKLSQAKRYVPEPSQPKIKLKMSAPVEQTPRITLRVGGKASPAESPAPQVTLNGGGNSPQNATAPRRNPFGSSQKTANAVPSLDQLERARSFSGSVASPSPSVSAVVKSEDGPKPSPLLTATVPSINQTSSNGSNRASTTPHTNGSAMLPPTNTTPGIPTSSNLGSTPYSQSYSSQPAYHPPNPSFESKWRQPGKDVSDAMITNLSIATHPGLNIARHFRMDLPPSATMTQQSITINLPYTHYYLQIKPTIARPSSSANTSSSSPPAPPASTPCPPSPATASTTTNLSSRPASSPASIASRSSSSPLCPRPPALLDPLAPVLSRVLALKKSSWRRSPSSPTY